MTWLTIITFILIVCIMVYSIHKGKLEWIVLGFVAGLLLVLFYILLAITCSSRRIAPTAIDVYRGKTTLEIIYRDSVSVDSVVVWKEE